jgi:hypothetical protein
MGLILGYFDFSYSDFVGMKAIIRDVPRNILWIGVVHERVYCAMAGEVAVKRVRL